MALSAGVVTLVSQRFCICSKLGCRQSIGCLDIKDFRIVFGKQRGQLKQQNKDIGAGFQMMPFGIGRGSQHRLKVQLEDRFCHR